MRSKTLLFVCIQFVFLCQASTNDLADSAPPSRNFISIDPVSLILGGLDANYERIFGHHGLLIEGQYTFPLLGSKSYDGVLAYRFHFRQSDLGGFVGPFIKTGDLESKIPDGSGTDYRYRFRYTTVGISVGKRGWLWERHNWVYAFRIGAGYPLATSWWWNIAPPETINGVSTDFLKTMTGLPAYLDGELGISFGF